MDACKPNQNVKNKAAIEQSEQENIVREIAII